MIKQTVKMDTVKNVNETYNKLQTYVTSTDMLVVASGVTIGLATKNLVESILRKAVAPLITYMITTSVWYRLYSYLEKRLVPSKLRLVQNVLTVAKEIIWEIILWIALVFIAVSVLRLFLARITKRQKLVDIGWYKHLIERVSSSMIPPWVTYMPSTAPNPIAELKNHTQSNVFARMNPTPAQFPWVAPERRPATAMMVSSEHK